MSAAGKFCANCGAQLADGATFCANCGAPVQPGIAPPPMMHAPPPIKKRARHPFLRIIGILAVLLIACVVIVAIRSGSSASNTGTSSTAQGGSSAPAAAATLGLNQTASTKNWAVTVLSVDRPGKDLTWSQFGNKSTAAGTWVVAVVKMKNTGTTNFGVNNSDFEIRASGGTKYSVSSDGGSYSYSAFKGGQQIGGQVPPGVEVTYYIPFDLAPTTSEMQLVFKQDKNPIFSIGNATP